MRLAKPSRACQPMMPKPITAPNSVATPESIRHDTCAETHLWTAGGWSFPASSQWWAGCTILVEQRYRGLLPDRPMRALFVVVPAPILHLFPRVRKVHEPVRVQTLGAEPTVECFDEGVVGRFAGPREVECDTVLVGPQIQVA